jgi:hypothetical protein
MNAVRVAFRSLRLSSSNSSSRRAGLPTPPRSFLRSSWTFLAPEADTPICRALLSAANANSAISSATLRLGAGLCGSSGWRFRYSWHAVIPTGLMNTAELVRTRASKAISLGRPAFGEPVPVHLELPLQRVLLAMQGAPWLHGRQAQLRQSNVTVHPDLVRHAIQQA